MSQLSHSSFDPTCLLPPPLSLRPPSPPSPPLSPAECFICTETSPVPSRSACACTNRYVHEACLDKMLKSTVHVKCPACAEPYKNVQFTYKIVGCTCINAGGASCMLAVASAVCLVCAANTWIAAFRAHLHPTTMRAVVGAAGLITVAGIGSCALLMRLIGIWGINGLLESCILKRKRVTIAPVEIVTAELDTAT